ncbi:MAG TPA: transcriptional regulator NrdR [Candidatus Marinimicrobia bacterium]|nr:MAG: transcriptional regulator NrdR [Candidatus Marinimicrobia bacterium CG1_02_48_14]PIZ63252.1 MAG: transcriptional regulator NrdR [Candidatus Marinimicrobia bacterium CG_4_10_14_0_2_um_filter_48_9]PJA54744.1 MAG: transcriptional regulator NrdR [Candidatus Marinimicrobia bacterium CG_4_9_14_3_um_filter_48_9]HCW75898.1 transcriptional regulator NrdR [Candidatus Neomarinimicrobiota bacterium]
MNCPKCKHDDTRVVDSRSTQEGTAIRRRRECLKCLYRFTTYEYVESEAMMVIKTDQKRETFNRDKILKSMVIACNKRPISMEKLNTEVDKIIQDINDLGQPEVTSKRVGEIVMKHLSALDQVAYVRFASVYRQFRDVDAFRAELDKI